MSTQPDPALERPEDEAPPTSAPIDADEATARDPVEGRVREVATVFVAVLAITVGLDLLSQVVPIVRANLLALVAGVFLLVPIWVLKKRGRSDRDYGLKLDRPLHGIGVGLLTTAITLVGFVPAYHLYQTKILDHELDLDTGRLARPSERLLGVPSRRDDGIVQVYDTGVELVVDWLPQAAPWRLELSAAESTEFGFGGAPDARTTRLTASGDQPKRVVRVVRTIGAGSVSITASEGGDAVDSSRFALGGGGGKARATGDSGGVRERVGFGWIPMALLVQLLLIALPEEFFYRGYLQERLSEGIGRRGLAIGPLRLTWSIVITSALFGLGHVAIGLDPTRFAVFFPSLLFGALRDHGGGLAAPITYHALCNMMVQMAVVFYV